MRADASARLGLLALRRRALPFFAVGQQLCLAGSADTSKQITAARVEAGSTATTGASRAAMAQAAAAERADLSAAYVKLIRCGTASAAADAPASGQLFRLLAPAARLSALPAIAPASPPRGLSSPLHRSAEGHVFHVERKCAVVAGTIRAMLAGEFREASGEIRFPEISTPILERVIRYFHHKVKWSNSTSPPPEFPIEPEFALDLLMAANYLDC